MVEHRVEWLNPFFVALSELGTLGLVWVALGALAALVWRRPLLLVAVVGADVAAQLTAAALKLAVDEERPPFRHPQVDPLVAVPASASFPSGHAASSFACAAVLAWCAPLRPLPLLALAAGIAFSRVYVGVHYPLDVIGGALLGLAVGVGVTRALARRDVTRAPPSLVEARTQLPRERRRG